MTFNTFFPDLFVSFVRFSYQITEQKFCMLAKMHNGKWV